MLLQRLYVGLLYHGTIPDYGQKRDAPRWAEKSNSRLTWRGTTRNNDNRNGGPTDNGNNMVDNVKGNSKARTTDDDPHHNTKEKGEGDGQGAGARGGGGRE